MVEEDSITISADSLEYDSNRVARQCLVHVNAIILMFKCGLYDWEKLNEASDLVFSTAMKLPLRYSSELFTLSIMINRIKSLDWERDTICEPKYRNNGLVKKIASASVRNAARRTLTFIDHKISEWLRTSR